MLRSVRHLAAIFLCGLALLLPGGASSQGPDDLDATLALVSDGDPLEVARIVAQAGDDAVLASLAPEAGADAMVHAIGAARWLQAPEAALSRLAAIAGGRDPDLAPAAAREAHRICGALDGSGVAGRDITSPEELWGVVAALRLVADDATAREDIRRLTALAGHELTAELPEPSTVTP